MTSASSPPSAPPAAPQRRRLGELLVTAKLISPEQRNQALDEARRNRMRLGQYLVLQKLIKEIHLVKAISFQLKVQMFHPEKHRVDAGVRELLSRAFAVQGNLCPVFRDEDVLYVAMLDPTDMHVVDEIIFATGLDVEPLICTKSQLGVLQAELYGADVLGQVTTPIPVGLRDGGLVLRDAIDLEAIQKPGAFASPQGLAANRFLDQSESRPDSPPAQTAGDVAELPSSRAVLSGPEAAALASDLSEMAANTGAAVSAAQPSLELTGDPEDDLPYVEALPVEELPQDAAAVPAGADTDAAADIFLRDTFISRRIQKVAGVKYEQAEVVRAALMLGLAVLEEEPGLVAALNLQTRDPWR
ncbi:GspE/PulE/PilB domain-containing protein [Megalodesulfovibrio gigas]|uniref:Putative type II secretion system protein E n=1 Tax=Megalodesulfovibrio gigas (strain ATCC 19364 / DSM 1382 / NCIMB 9332 / VKM B-1759) TaxID=1121448 RepID=T2G9R7_MEGG1|nr:type II secretion system protein E [Megalodesulfovibrio gigas]AGW12871.1 putative type II secretion system protein E [Megalodesulfovibrio gigas DSM 1382 = ATCC 19364]